MTDPLRTLLITGGSKGIGRATVLLFLKHGWRVVFTARNAEGIAAFEEELTGRGFSGDRFRGLVLDAADLAGIDHLAKKCEWLSGRLDALVLNAFYQKIQPAHTFDAETLNRHWTINNLSPILTMNALTPALKEAGGAVVGNVQKVSQN